MNKIKKVFYYLFFAVKQLFVYTISAIIPKNKKLWVFGAWEGQLYADNSKYLYEYVKTHNKKIRCIWITRNQDVYKKLKRDNEVYLFPSIKAYKVLLSAGAVIETEGNRDVGGFILARTKIIQLWHGVAPKKANWIKRIGKIKKLYNKFFIDNHEKSYWMTSSIQNGQIMHEFMGTNLSRSFDTGYPRNDILLRKKVKSDIMRELSEMYPKCKIILYMPTHRNFGLNGGSTFSQVELIELDKMLKIENYIMVFKSHFHELKNYLNMTYNFSNIVFANDNKYSDVYSYIGDFDMLISDYSSIIYDFLCTRKPIVIFAYDLKSFNDTDGLFDYFERLPAGPFAFTWTEVIKQAKMLFQGSAEWNEKREACRKFVHPYDDGKNCERVMNTIEKLLE